MKLSNLIAEITQLAEEKFGVTGHTNDWIEVTISYAPGTNAQVSLMRPSRKQLDCGEVPNPKTVKVWESNFALYCEGPTLREALLLLKSLVESVDTDIYDDDLAHFFRV